MYLYTRALYNAVSRVLYIILGEKIKMGMSLGEWIDLYLHVIADKSRWVMRSIVSIIKSLLDGLFWSSIPTLLFGLYTRVSVLFPNDADLLTR